MQAVSKAAYYDEYEILLVYPLQHIEIDISALNTIQYSALALSDTEDLAQSIFRLIPSFAQRLFDEKILETRSSKVAAKKKQCKDI